MICHTHVASRNRRVTPIAFALGPPRDATIPIVRLHTQGAIIIHALRTVLSRKQSTYHQRKIASHIAGNRRHWRLVSVLLFTPQRSRRKSFSKSLATDAHQVPQNSLCAWGVPSQLLISTSGQNAERGARRACVLTAQRA